MKVLTALTAQGSGGADPGPGRPREPYVRVEPSVVQDRPVIRAGGLPAEGRVLVCGVHGRGVIRRSVAASVEQALVAAAPDTLAVVCRRAPIRFCS